MAAKIKDGLFIGDAETSQSEDFINDNKISNLINLSAREVPNVWAAHGLVYLTFQWEDRPDFRLGLSNPRRPTDKDFVHDIVEFIDISIQHGISVLLFSKSGTGRCIVAVCAYLMVKYGWGFQKTYDFVYSKKPDINLNRGFLQQLFLFDKHLLTQMVKGEKQQQLLASALREGAAQNSDPATTLNLLASAVLTKLEFMRWSDWDITYIISQGRPQSSVAAAQQQQTQTLQALTLAATDYDKDELLLVHSFENSKHTITQLPGPYKNALDTPKSFKLRFNDKQLLLEEDVHVFPTSPDRGALPGLSILKHSNNQHSRDRGQLVSTAAVMHAQEKPSSNHHNNNHASHSSERQQLGYAQDKSSGSGGGGAGGPSGAEQQAGGGAQGDSGDEDDDISDVSSCDNNMEPAHRGTAAHAQARASSQSSGSRSAKGASLSQGGRAPATSSDDLYGYVGVTVSDKSAGQPSSSSSSAASAQAKHLSAEDRLRNLVANMHQPDTAARGASPARPQQTDLRRSADRDKERDRQAGAGPGSSSASVVTLASHMTQSSNTPSLFDLATMSISPNHSRPGGSSTATATATATAATRASQQRASSRDPLSAFEQLPVGPGPAAATSANYAQNGAAAVRARHDVVISTQPQQGSGATGRAREGWLDPALSSSGGAALTGAGQRERVTPRQDSQQQQSQPVRTYRHGSPAPRVSRSGTGPAPGSVARPTDNISSNNSLRSSMSSLQDPRDRDRERDREREALAASMTGRPALQRPSSPGPQRLGLTQQQQQAAAAAAASTLMHATTASASQRKATPVTAASAVPGAASFRRPASPSPALAATARRDSASSLLSQTQQQQQQQQSTGRFSSPMMRQSVGQSTAGAPQAQPQSRAATPTSSSRSSWRI